jgi:hypothetical protein
VNQRKQSLWDELKNMVASKGGIEAAVLELRRVTVPSETEGMILALAELAKMGFVAKDIARIAEAVEHSQIIGFEAGRLRHLGQARSLREIASEDQP